MNSHSLRFATLLLCLSLLNIGEQANAVEDSTATARRPFGEQPHAIPGKIEAENYDRGKPGEVYYDVDEKNHGADYRGETQVDIEKRDDASGGHGIGWTKAGEWVSYSVSISEAGSYDVNFPVASKRQGGTFHLELNDKDITGPIQVPDTGSWKKLQVITKEGVELPAGNHVLKMVMDTQGKSGFVMDVDYLQFVKAKP